MFMTTKSLFGNYEGRCFRGKGRMARRDEGGAARGHHGATPKAFASRAKPVGLFRENPPGGGSFIRGRRWLVPYSPLRGCAELAALATAKIPRRSAPRSFQTGSKAVSWSLRQVTRLSEIGAPTFLHA